LGVVFGDGVVAAKYISTMGRKIGWHFAEYELLNILVIIPILHAMLSCLQIDTPPKSRIKVYLKLLHLISDARKDLLELRYFVIDLLC
jgi:hypothetical protein